jgi:hypothetical protein
MKFEVKNRHTHAISFIADIKCKKDEPTSIKLGLAIKWAMDNKADLRSTNLSSADLRSANLSFALGDNNFVKTIQADKYIITFTKDIINIGCEKHTKEEWVNFTDKEIIAMDGKEALIWWKKWKPILITIVE